MPTETLEDLLRQPATLADLIARLNELSREVRADPERWENARLDRYLEAMAAWLQAFQGPGRVDPEPSWRLVITALEAAAIYE